MGETITQQTGRTSIAAQILSGAGHIAMTFVIFGLFASPFLSAGVVDMVGTGVVDPQIQGPLLKDLAIMFGLAVCTWALLFVAYTHVRDRIRRQKTMVVVKTRGSVMTESLIVLPVFLLLTFGLGQMGVNSMAGLLTTLGTFQAARTLAVWGPEVGSNRSGTTVSRTNAEDRARIAAAAVIAPVAPMSAGNILCTKTNAFRKLVGGMVAAGLAPVEAPQRYNTFSDALDTSTFAQRGPAKLAGAYCSVGVTYSGDMRTNPGATEVGSFTTKVAYKHKMVFPLVGLAFGGTPTPGGWLTTIERTYSLTHHLTPNPILPKKNDIL
jgi:hypothetical protein